MSKATQEYRRFAVFCMRMSRVTHSAELRDSWLRLAENWAALISDPACAAENSPRESCRNRSLADIPVVETMPGGPWSRFAR